MDSFPKIWTKFTIGKNEAASSGIAREGRAPGIRGISGFAMIKSDFKSVDAYIEAQPKPVQSVLESVRRAIRKAVPEAREVISYKMPTYKLPGGPVLYLAGWKRHYSLYPASKPIVAALKEELEPYVVAKGTIRFPFSEPVPVKLIQRIAKLRAKEITKRVKTEPATGKKR
jgi:uncharacterized protein YdhG (YjbR/CyaY superfamily)